MVEYPSIFGNTIKEDLKLNCFLRRHFLLSEILVH